jgi:hypothetical protein
MPDLSIDLDLLATHLRALPGLASPDVEALVAMVKAGYRPAKELRAKKGS